MKRISFGEMDAAHIFEWWLAVRQVAPEMKNCFECTAIVKRLRKFIGKAEADRLVRLTRKNPYKK